jgi:hypothetical protein
MQGHTLSGGLLTSVVMREVAAGTTSTTSTAVDMLGYAGVRFIAAFGALTASHVTSVHAQHSDDNSTFEDVAGSSTGALEASPGTTASGKLAILDIFKPTKRYVRVSVNRATANAVINGVIAERFRPAWSAVTADTTVAQSVTLANPATGTA